MQALLGELLADVGDTLESSFALVVVQALKTERVTVLLKHNTKVPQAARLPVPPVAKMRSRRERIGCGPQHPNTSPVISHPLALKVGPAAVVVDY